MADGCAVCPGTRVVVGNGEAAAETGVVAPGLGGGGEAVAVGVFVGGPGVSVMVGIRVWVGVRVGVALGLGVLDGVGVRVGVGVAVG